MNFFNGLKDIMSNKDAHRNELRTWATIEYKKDAEFAYNYMLNHGVAPNAGAK